MGEGRVSWHQPRPYPKRQILTKFCIQYDMRTGSTVQQSTLISQILHKYWLNNVSIFIPVLSLISAASYE